MNPSAERDINIVRVGCQKLRENSTFSAKGAKDFSNSFSNIALPTDADNTFPPKIGDAVTLFCTSDYLFGSSVRLYGTSAQIFWTSVRLFESSVRLYGSSACLYGTSVHLYGSRVLFFGTPVVLYGTFVRAYGSCVQLFGDSANAGETFAYAVGDAVRADGTPAHKIRLSESNVARRARLLLLDVAADFQETIKHFGALGAARGELRVGLFVQAFQAMKFVRYVERGEDCDLQGVNRERPRRDLAHTRVNELGQLRYVFAVAVGANVVGLVVDFHADGGCCCCVHIAFRQTHLVISVLAHCRTASAISGSSAAIASSIASTFMRIVSRSDSRRST